MTAAAILNPQSSIIYRGRAGRVQFPVTVYADRDGRFTISYSLKGRRIRTRRKLLAAARAKADEWAKSLAEGKAHAAELTNADRAMIERIVAILAPIGVAPELACAQFVEAFQISKGRVVEAARFHAEHGALEVPEISAADAIAKFIEAKRGEITGDYFTHLCGHLKKFGRFFEAPMSALKSSHILDWIDTVKGGVRTRKNHRASLFALCQFCKLRGWLPKAWDEFAGLPMLKPAPKDIKILSPDEMRALLHAAVEECAELVPFIALAGFAGLRHAEILRLDWKDINFGRKDIYLNPTITKTRTARYAPISPNLAAWLRPYARAAGRVAPDFDISEHLTRLKRLAGIPAGRGDTRNILRPSFISYRKAKKGIGIEKAADEAGNSPGVIKKHYLFVVPQRDADRWFSIRPTGADKVITANFARA